MKSAFINLSYSTVSVWQEKIFKQCESKMKPIVVECPHHNTNKKSPIINKKSFISLRKVSAAVGIEYGVVNMLNTVGYHTMIIQLHIILRYSNKYEKFRIEIMIQFTRSSAL